MDAYLLEILNIENVPAEPNLICQFDNQGYSGNLYKEMSQRLPTLSSLYGMSHTTQSGGELRCSSVFSINSTIISNCVMRLIKYKC